MRVSEGGRSGGEAGEGDGGSSAPWCWYIVSTLRWGKKTQFPANIYRACFSSGWYHLEAGALAGVIWRPGGWYYFEAVAPAEGRQARFASFARGAAENG